MDIKENKGIIFKNTKKTNENQPDYRGEINVDGVKKDIALWVKKGEKGSFFSVGISEPYRKEEPDTVPAKMEEQTDDLPF